MKQPEYTTDKQLYLGPIAFPTCPFCGHPKGWGHAGDCKNPGRKKDD